MSALKKAGKIAAVVLSIPLGIFVLVLFLNVLPFAPRYGGVNPMRIEPGSAPHIVPHGGAKELFPENTIYAYEQIAQRGWDTFEIDLCITSDGQLVTHHDLDIFGTTGVDGVLVADLSYEQLKTYNFAANFTALDGSRPYADSSQLSPDLRARLVPARLADLFGRYPDSYYILELKDTVDASGSQRADQAVEELIRLIREYRMEDRVVVSSFDDEVTSDFRSRTGGDIPTGAATMDTLILSVLSALKLDFFLRPDYSSVMLPIRDQIYPAERAIIEALPRSLRNALSSYDAESDTLYTNLANQRMVDDAHRKNLAVYYWTVNDREDMEFLIRLGVDGIITDRPDILQELIEEMGL